jgi:hypothetical protein
MPEAKAYKGSCHCGKVSYEATTDLAKVLQCNCSICSRSGYLLTFVQAEQFTLKSGDDAVSDYQFNTHNIHHLFCNTCGIRSYAHGTARDGTPMFAVNVRCLEGVDPKALQITEVDGRSL